MQKNTKDLIEDKPIKKKTTKSKSSVVKDNNSSTSKKSATSAKKANSKATSADKKVPTTKSTKVSSSKSSSKSKTQKVSTSKSSKKTTQSKTTKKKQVKKVDIIEYYDLPYRYNQTIVKILAQTPNTLFVYWDISDSDREAYLDKYGKDFFNHTVPILVVHNKTKNYSFEIEINDFANSWYFNINDANCEYEIELGRRSISNIIDLPNNYMYVTSSNVIESPNNHILFEKNTQTVFFRNVKTNTTISKNVSKFEFMKYAGKVYNIYDVYKKIYKAEQLKDLENNPSSSF